MPDKRTYLAAAALLLVVVPAAAADFPVTISSARVGLPPGNTPNRDESGQAAYVTKFACWAPVYVELEIGSPINDSAELVIEAADPDEITTALVVPLNLVGAANKVAAANLGSLGYVRPAGVGEVTITVRLANGGKVLSAPYRIRSLRPRDPLTYVVLSLGAQPSGFDLPKPASGAPDQSMGFRGGRVEVTAITDVAQLPDQWFGYDTADLVVLHTGTSTEDFIRKLFGESAAAKKLTALMEWVRRGGRFVVSIGGGAELVAKMPALKELLPIEVTGSRPTRTLAVYWGARESSQTSTFTGTLVPHAGLFPLAQLVPRTNRPARVLIPPPDRQADIKDVIAAQGAFGLGRVTVIAFELDQPPFSDFALRAEFWDWILREGGASRASLGSEGKPRPVGAGLSEDEDELAIAFAHCDTFDGVPVVCSAGSRS